MSERTWLRITSWHAIRTMTRAGRYLTVCGRQAPADSPISETLPGGRSCESCLRSMARADDTPPDVTEMSEEPA